MLPLLDASRLLDWLASRTDLGRHGLALVNMLALTLLKATKGSAAEKRDAVASNRFEYVGPVIGRRPGSTGIPEEWRSSARLFASGQGLVTELQQALVDADFYELVEPNFGPGARDTVP